MVRFKTRWLLLSIDDQPQAATSPFRNRTYPGTKSPSAAASLTPQAITRLLRASLLNNFGDVAAGSFGGVLTCKYYSARTGTAIIRCTRDAARLVWAAATLISSTTELPPPTTAAASSASAGSNSQTHLRIRVLHCGGTIKKLQTKAIELDRRIILRLRQRQAQPETNNNGQPDHPSEPPTLSAPIASGLEDEDLGETLDNSLNQPPIAKEKQIKPQSHQDPDTAILLAASKREINAISM